MPDQDYDAARQKSHDDAVTARYLRRSNKDLDDREPDYGRYLALKLRREQKSAAVAESGRKAFGRGVTTRSASPSSSGPPQQTPDEEPEEKGFIQRLAERFFPPAALGGLIEEKLENGRRTPPAGRRRPRAGAPIDMMAGASAIQRGDKPRTTPGRDMELFESSGRDVRKKKAKGSEGYYDAAGTR